jgi:hypothetical protein
MNKMLTSILDTLLAIISVTFIYGNIHAYSEYGPFTKEDYLMKFKWEFREVFYYILQGVGILSILYFIIKLFL